MSLNSFMESSFCHGSEGLPKWFKINNSHLVKRLKIGSLFTNYLNFDLSKFLCSALLLGSGLNHAPVNVSINAVFCHLDLFQK